EPAYYIPLNNLNNLHHLPGSLELAAAEILKSLGVEHPLPAVQAAIGRGITLADVERIAEHFRLRPGCWDAGALHCKVNNWLPGDAPDKGWPRPSPKWIACQRSQQDAARAAQQRQEREQSKQGDQQAISNLESRHGPTLDAMDDAAIWRFIASTPGGEFYKSTWRKSGRESQSLRRWLLSRLAAVQHKKEDQEHENQAEPILGERDR
ncbi:MAG: hypothetical protein KDA76_12080, partial [Planctomycetaceae bacterium]|nr:hypothetical protein [Planctomycetaceae bacterium]